MTISPTGDLHRIAPSRTPWEAYRGTSFEQRFDDPGHRFFVLYASSERLTCFMECLAYFRVNPEKLGFTELQDKFGHSFPEGAVPTKWCSNRFSQTAKVAGNFAEVGHSDWLARLLKNFPEKLRSGQTYPWLDQSTIYQDKFRAVTQWISRFVFDAEPSLAGLHYTSKLGSDFSNWAIFDGRATIAELGILEAITEQDVDLLKACMLLHLHAPASAVSQPAMSQPELFG